MSHISSPHEPFPFIRSKEDHQEILAFIRQNQGAADRLLAMLADAPGKVEDGVYKFAKPIHVKVDAERFTVSRKEPKLKPNSGKSYRITFELSYRSLGPVAAPALAIATAVGCMRIRAAICASNLVAKTGHDAHDMLNQMVGAIIDQIDAAAAQLSMDITLH